ncbi:MAG: signal peptide peptidase SppA [Candidatus Hatepunaea meridiana]|nr:signal peptide peptidase SppA [Candidatus Hatepunaea meridiana]
MRQITIKLFASIILFVFQNTTIAQLPPDFLQLPPHSVATIDNALSPIINPAGLGIKNGESIYLIAPYLQKSDFGDWGVALGGDGLGFVGEFKRNDVYQNRDRCTLGFGLGKNGVYFGTAYSWTKGVDRQNNWDVGLMARPFKFISFGAVARGINRPRITVDFYYPIHYSSFVGWDIGLAIKPLSIFGPSGSDSGEWLTVFSDASIRKYHTVKTLYLLSDNYDEYIRYKIGASVKIISGITGHIEYLPEIKNDVNTRDNQLYAGLTLNFGHFKAGGHQNNGSGNGVSWIAVNNLYRPTILKKQYEKFVEISLSGTLVEYQGVTPWYIPRHRTLYRLLRQIKRYENDPDVRGILLRLEGFGAGWAQIQEIREALIEFMVEGKGVVVYLDTCGNGMYYLASVADHIFMNPVGEIGLTGLSTHSTFFRNTLDMLGLDPEFAHAGKYKSANEMYKRNSMSDAHREELNYVLDDLYNQFIDGITEGRGYVGEQVGELIDDGPFSAEDAYSAGLVDSLVYEDEIEDLLKEFYTEKTALIKESKQNRRIPVNDHWDDLRMKSIAIVFGCGAIVRGASSDGGLFTEETMGSATIAKALQDAREDKSVKAIVLRINSPGGSMLASDIILREVRRCTEGDDQKPIIVSMSDVAGSGGYYIACMADTIIAMPGTITGSIGVISGKLAYHRLQKKIGISTETLTRGKHAGIWSGYRSFTDEEWKKVCKDVDKSYQIFLQHVAEGRKMTTSEVDSIAQGRIWTGNQADSLDLVDMTGGFDLAIQLAAHSGGIKDGDSFQIKMYPKAYDFSFGDELLGVMMNRIPDSVKKVMTMLSEENRWEAGEPLLLMPYRLEIE